MLHLQGSEKEALGEAKNKSRPGPGYWLIDLLNTRKLFYKDPPSTARDAWPYRVQRSTRIELGRISHALASIQLILSCYTILFCYSTIGMGLESKAGLASLIVGS